MNKTKIKEKLLRRLEKHFMNEPQITVYKHICNWVRNNEMRRSSEQQNSTGLHDFSIDSENLKEKRNYLFNAKSRLQ